MGDTDTKQDTKQASYSYSGYSGIEADSVAELLKYWVILRRYILGILGLTLLFTIAGVLIALSITPVYTSTAILLLETKTPKVLSIDQVYGIDAAKPAYYETQRQILLSRQFGEKVIDDLKLRSRPEFTPVKHSSTESKLDWTTLLPNWHDWIPQGLFPGVTAAITQKADSKESAASTVWEQFSKSLDIDFVPNSQLISISFESSDRKLAADVANAVANNYIQNDMEARLEMTTTATRFLSERLKDLRAKLEESESALQAYREQEHLIDVQGVKTISTEQLSGLSTKLVDAQQRLADAQSAHSQVLQAKANGNALDSIPAVLKDGLVANLKQALADAQRAVSALAGRYGPDHPKMAAARSDLVEAKARVNERIQEVISGVEKDYQSARANLESVQQSIDATKDELQQISRKGYKLGVLEREVETNRNLYNLFLGRLKETSETEGLQTSSARIMDTAVPANNPTKPKKPIIILVAALIGLALGMVLALLREYLDRTIKNTGDFEEYLQIPALGSLPRIRLHKEETPVTHLRTKPQGLFGESLRTIRTGVVLSSLDQTRRVILVTSAIAQEGKSCLAATLADSLSELHKVLLIDADLRRPSLHEKFKLEAGLQGLSELVAGRAEILNCLIKVENRNLFILPSGAIPPNPLGLLASHRFVNVLQQLSEAFEHIVIDCAPTLPVSDALVLCPLVTDVVYVVLADSTPYPVVQEGLKRLRRANARLIGGVINQMPIGKGGGYEKYGYADSYGSYGYVKDSTT